MIFQAAPRVIKQKYRCYSPTSLHNAYKYVRETKVSVCRAARVFGVPEQTLRDRIKGKIDPECVTTGREPVLSLMEEAKIVNHLKCMAKYGYGYTKQETVDIATEYAIRLGKRRPENPLTLAWFEGFRSRWADIKVQKPRSLDHVRAKMANRDTIQSYFNNLETTLKKYNLTDKPHLIFNVDEKGISMDHKPPHIVHVTANPPAVTSGKSKTITVLGCGSASGVAIPPYFVFHGKRMLPDLLKGCLPGTAGTVSETGWSNSLIFRQWIQHFLKYIPGRAGDPVLLILDGHKSHTSVGLTEWALEHNIVIFVLPAHCSHILQPMDVACYGPFQKIYNFNCHKFIRQTSATISRYNVCELACNAYSKALSSENLQAGFRKTGIYPVDIFAIPTESLTPAEIFDSDIDNDSQLTVVGGVMVGTADDDFAGFMKEKESNLKQVKSNAVVKKPRKTLSAITAGKEITDHSVLSKMREHEKSQAKSNQKMSACAQPGPSSASTTHKQFQDIPQNINCNSDDDLDLDIEVDKCCVCNRVEPIEVSRSKNLIITDWAQCDGKLGRKPCLHWVHLKFCCPVTFVGKSEKFYCPHCADYEE